MDGDDGINHEAQVPLVENRPPKTYIATSIAKGEIQGDEVRIGLHTSNAYLIIERGNWPDGRQFLVSIHALAAAVSQLPLLEDPKPETEN